MPPSLGDIFLNGQIVAEAGLTNDYGADLFLLQGVRALGIIESLDASSVSVWGLSPFLRGRLIHEALGENLPQTFPVFDIFSEGVATSIKTLDLSAQSYASGSNLLSTLTGYINSAAGFPGATVGSYTVTPGMISSRVLEIAVPDVGLTSVQQAAFNSAVAYGASQNVQVIMTVVP